VKLLQRVDPLDVARVLGAEPVELELELGRAALRQPELAVELAALPRERTELGLVLAGELGRGARSRPCEILLQLRELSLERSDPRVRGLEVVAIRHGSTVAELGRGLQRCSSWRRATPRDF
jgi:hypothetical protein